jgi:hypothetical protein
LKFIAYFSCYELATIQFLCFFVHIQNPTPKDGNGQGMGWVEQYHIHTYIVDGYKVLPVSVPMCIKLYPYPYLAGTHTHWVPNG